MIDWVCGINNKTIKGAVGWNEEKKILVPSWRPLSPENYAKKG